MLPRAHLDAFNWTAFALDLGADPLPLVLSFEDSRLLAPKRSVLELALARAARLRGAPRCLR